MQERRELPRWHIGKPAKVRLDIVDDFHDCYVEDMNLKGMCLSLPQRLPQDRSIRMALAFEDDLDFEVEVQVPWIREEEGRYVHGLSFSIIMDGDKDQIYRYMSNTCFKQFRDKWWGK